jgi:hypothetical protein
MGNLNGRVEILPMLHLDDDSRPRIETYLCHKNTVSIF